MRYTLVLIFFIICLSQTSFSQLVNINPANATTNSDVTITYNAALGNGELQGYTSKVYTYTGVITTESLGDWDWKHVRSNWGVVNPNTLMTSLGNDLYQISFNISQFYELEPNEIVIKLALLFHSEDYQLVGRTETGGDIFIEINKQSPGDYVSHNLIGEMLEITSDNGLYQIQFYNNSLVKAEYIHNESDILDTTFTVIALPESITPSLVETANSLSFSSSNLEVYITKEPLRLHYIVGADTLLAESTGFEPTLVGGSIGLRVKGTQSFYGGGSRAVPIDRRGRKLKIYNEAHYGYSNNTPTLNISIPLVVSSKGYGLFFDNRYPAFLDLDSDNSQTIKYSTEGGRLRYYFIAGNDFDGVLENYTFLTGKQKIPPLWALGYIQSKFGYQTETEARNIVNKIRQNNFPLDALILDLYWFGSTNDMGNLDWHLGQWPQPQQMISDFSDLGIQTILITEPYFTLNSINYQALVDNNFLATNADGDPYVLWGFWAGNAALLDITQVEAQEWMWNFYHARREEGVSGWWCDLGEPENHPWDMQHQLGNAKSVHNIYSLLWAKFIDEKYSTHYPNERLFNLIRSGYAGMQRHSTFPWSGDIQRSFNGLQAQIPIMLGAGMSGLGYMHSDVGGFVGNDNDGELFTRWVQFGVFAPILRLHGVGTTEPVNFPEPYRSIMRNYINLRYQLLPYNYTLAYENTLYGTPLARQLNYHEPANSSLANVNDTYLWGKDFLIAPVLERSISSRTVMFPQGKWIDFNNLKEYNENQSYTVSCNINDIPVFVRAGSFIPTIRPIQTTASYSSDSLIVKYYPDPDLADSYGYMFVDDGLSASTLAEQQYELLHFNGTTTEDEIQIVLTKTGGSFTSAPQLRNMVFELFRISNKPSSVTVDGVEIPEVTTLAGFNTDEFAYFWDSSTMKLYLNSTWDGSIATIVISGSIVNSVTSPDIPSQDFIMYNPWPNPFSDEINISANFSTPGDYAVTLTNTTGLVVLRKQLNFSQAGIETVKIIFDGNLPKGVYFLTLRGSNGILVRRVVRN